MLILHRCVCALLLVLLTTVGCSSISVTTDWDNEANFAELTTFSLLDPQPQPQRARGKRASPLAEKRLLDALSAALTERGFTKTTRRRADMLVAIHNGSRERTVVSHHGYGYGPRWRWHHGFTQVHRYREGALVVDIVDARSKELVWRGVATAPAGKPDPSGETAAKIVDKLLRDFPPE